MAWDKLSVVAMQYSFELLLSKAPQFYTTLYQAFALKAISS